MTSHPIDKEVTMRARNGEELALSLIYQRYAEELFRYIYVRIGDVEEAEDIRSEVFLRMLEGIRLYEDRGHSISAWLYRIAHDRVIDVYRQRKRHLSISWDAWNGSYQDIELEIYLAKESHARIWRALSRLGDDQRAVIVLRFFADMSTDEVAQALSKTKKSVKALRHRGLAAMAEYLNAA